METVAHKMLPCCHGKIFINFSHGMIQTFHIAIARHYYYKKKLAHWQTLVESTNLSTASQKHQEMHTKSYEHAMLAYVYIYAHMHIAESV